MLRYLLLAILFIGLYKFIIRVVLPVLRVTSAVRGQMKHMQNGQGSQANAAASSSSRGKSPKNGEYIEFEEVR